MTRTSTPFDRAAKRPPPKPDDSDKLRADLKRAKDLLREWRDKWGGREQHAISGTYPGARVYSASPTDLLRETNHFLEGR